MSCAGAQGRRRGRGELLPNEDQIIDALVVQGRDLFGGRSLIFACIHHGDSPSLEPLSPSLESRSSERSGAAAGGSLA